MCLFKSGVTPVVLMAVYWRNTRMKLESGVKNFHDPNLINNEFAFVLEMLKSGNGIRL